MAVIISDFLGPINWMRPLRAIAGRHEVLGIEIVDPRDVELPDVGDVILQDTESGVTREFTIDAQLRDDFAKAAQAPPRRGGPHAAPLRCAAADPAHRPGLDRRRGPVRAPTAGAAPLRAGR